MAARHSLSRKRTASLVAGKACDLYTPDVAGRSADSLHERERAISCSGGRRSRAKLRDKLAALERAAAGAYGDRLR